MRSESCSFIWHPKVRTTYLPATGQSYGSGRAGPEPAAQQPELGPDAEHPPLGVRRVLQTLGPGQSREIGRSSGSRASGFDCSSSAPPAMPVSTRMRSEISTMTSGFSNRKFLAFSLP